MWSGMRRRAVQREGSGSGSGSGSHGVFPVGQAEPSAANGGSGTGQGVVSGRYGAGGRSLRVTTPSWQPPPPPPGGHSRRQPLPSFTPMTRDRGFGGGGGASNLRGT